MGYGISQTGICPHCRVGVRFEPVEVNNVANASNIYITTPSKHWLAFAVSSCPHCGQPIIAVSRERDARGQELHAEGLLWPDTAARPIPAELSSEDPALARDFVEAAVVYSKSPKASAALSRRCLQKVLTTKGGALKRDLADQIDEVLPKLPSQLAANVDAIRQVGNFAAHPLKSTSTGEILEVEEGEAQWLLDVLEELFDYYYVAPAKAAALRQALNAKLSDAQKPPLKKP